MRIFFILVGLMAQLVLSRPAAYATDAGRPSGDPVRAGKDSPQIQVDDRLLTAQINGLPLRQVLSVITRASGIRIFAHGPSDERITATFNRLPFDEALRRILHGKNFVFLYAERSEANGVQVTGLREVHVYGGPGRKDDARPNTFRSVALSAQPVAVEGERGAGNESPTKSEQVIPRETHRGRRKRSAEDLGKMWSPEALPPLVRALSDDDPSVRASAATALGGTWNEGALAPLAGALLSDQAPHVREAAARALGETWSEGAVRPLSQALLRDPNRSVRQAAAGALGEIGGLDSVRSLESALSDRDLSVREQVAQALGRTGSPRAIEVLSVVLWRDKDPWVRQRAADSLQKILRVY
jgi:hypothetical protein